MMPGSVSKGKGRMVVKIPCVRATQHGRTIYVGALSAHDLAVLYGTETAKVDIWDPSHEIGYQRALSPTRARRFGRYVSEGSVSPTGVVMYQRNPDNGIEYRDSVLNVPLPADGEKAAEPLLYIVDGQHRTFGISEAFREGWIDDSEEVEIPVTIMVNRPESAADPLLEEATQFLIINTEQKRVRTDLAHQIILRQTASTHGKIKDSSRIPSGLTRDDQVPYATSIANRLSERSGSPWHDKIVRPNVQRNTTGLPSQGQFEDSLLDNYLGLGSVVSWAAGSGLTVGEATEVLANYWTAVFELCPGPVGDPDSYVLTKTAGTHAVNGVLAAIFSARRNLPKVPSVVEFREILESMGNVFTDDFWLASTGEAASYGTGKKSFKELAKVIFDALP